MGAIMRPSLFLESVETLYFTDFAGAFSKHIEGLWHSLEFVGEAPVYRARERQTKFKVLAQPEIRNRGAVLSE